MNKKFYILAFAPTLWGTAAFADTDVNWSRGYDQMMWAGGHGLLGGLMMLVFWGVIIALIFFAVRWFSDNKPGTRTDNALDLLSERFAKGEIDEEEFRKRKAALKD